MMAIIRLEPSFTVTSSSTQCVPHNRGYHLFWYTSTQSGYQRVHDSIMMIPRGHKLCTTSVHEPACAYYHDTSGSISAMQCVSQVSMPFPVMPVGAGQARECSARERERERSSRGSREADSMTA